MEKRRSSHGLKLESALEALYQEVDRRASHLRQIHGAHLRCGPGCHACCVDGITVFTIEAENIRTHFPELLEKGRPHPEGSCAFLSESGECRIYAVRPYVCRTQGLPLRWIEEDESGGGVEMRDICPLNDRGIPLERLPADQCWEIGPIEQQLAALQFALRADRRDRVRLRDLFRRER